MKIGEIAGQVGLTMETVRYYEKQGLITAPMRNASGYRKYSSLNSYNKCTAFTMWLL